MLTLVLLSSTLTGGCSGDPVSSLVDDSDGGVEEGGGEQDAAAHDSSADAAIDLDRTAPPDAQEDAASEEDSAPPDACADVACTSPPPSVCLDSASVRTFEPRGTCSNGQCAYTSSDYPCADGCTNGACVGDPCATVSCNNPPPGACVAANTLRLYESTGTCAGGVCTYTRYSDIPCPHGCSSGQCVFDACAGVTCEQPPPAVCVASNIRQWYATTGTCDGGACAYAPRDELCTYGCTGGACAPDPCSGVTCDHPPATYCVTSEALVSYASAGTCDGGTCSYPSTVTTCSSHDVCTGGACVCSPSTCASEARDCGVISDGCGGTADCGTCPAPSTCGSDNRCTKFPNGTTCVNEKNCLRGGCVGQKCCSRFEAACITTSDCCAGLACKGGFCAPPSQTCWPNDNPCYRDSDCCSNDCGVGGYCSVPSEYLCRLEGQVCDGTVDTTCCRDLECVGGSCKRTCKGTGASCVQSAECCSGQVCWNGTCRL